MQAREDKNIRPGPLTGLSRATTAAYDRGNKFAAYRRIASLQAFILIEPDQRRIGCYRRSHDSVWELHEAEPDQPLEFSSIGVTVPWERVFRNAD